MAKTRFSSVCILLLLATTVQSGLGLPVPLIGSAVFLNNAGDMTIRNMPKSGSINDPDLGDQRFPLGVYFDFTVSPGVTTVITLFKMTNSTGSYDQAIFSWTSGPELFAPVLCKPDCVWTVESSGFSVINPANEEQVFIVGWNGPNH